MPRNYTKTTDRADIDEENIKLAIYECLKNKLKISEAARQYGIKRTTLQSRIKTLLMKKPIEEVIDNDSGHESEPESKYSSKYTVKQIFTIDREAELCAYIKRCSDLHYGLSYKQIRILALQFAKSIPSCKVPDNWTTNQMASKDWLYGFMKRHNDLSLRKPESTSLSRSIAFNKPIVDEFFDKYISILARFNFNGDQIWNLDETGITTVIKHPKIVSTKGKKQVGQIASGERGVLVTFVGIINAMGRSVPPVFVFPRIRNPSEYLSEQSPTGSLALGNKSGWMTTELFPEVLKHIVKHTHCSTELKLLLLVDNHESHISVEAISYCKANGIVLLSFPPHTTHRLQPLDVGVYAPFKTHLATAFNDWMLAHPGQAITIRNIGYLANKAYENAFTLKNIKSAFQKTGLWPPDRLVFSESDFVASGVSDRPLAVTNQNDTASSKLETSTEISIKGGLASRKTLNEMHSFEESQINLDKPSTSSRNSNQGHSGEPSLEDIRPFPKAEMTKKRTRTRKSKSTVYTHTGVRTKETTGTGKGKEANGEKTKEGQKDFI